MTSKPMTYEEIKISSNKKYAQMATMNLHVSLE
jgi:hypothetical protein